jgi:glucokinase
MADKTLTLAADIGGTNARFALVERGAVLVKKETEANDYASISDAALAFLSETKRSIGSAIFAVAAPVTGDQIVFTNSPWRFSRKDLAAKLGVKSLHVVNDFVAMARGAVEASRADLFQVKHGAATQGAPVAVLGPGTGLGLGIVLTVGGRKIALATQGGFSAFAPQDAREFEVWRFLLRELSYVAFEHVLSGRGLLNVYRALASIEGAEATLKQPEDVTAAALNSADTVARSAAIVFCDILGTFAGDAALMTGARGGVILAGGILPKMQAILAESSFTHRFQSRDQMGDYMRDIPVSLLSKGDAALIGAALLADER